MHPVHDIEKTIELRDLFAVPAEQRDPVWRHKFYVVAPGAALTVLDPQIAEGPDRFPYFGLVMPATGAFTPFSINYALEFVLDRGAGVAIFATPDRAAAPQWVFTYGDLVSYRLFGIFEGSATETAPVQSGGNILVAAPSEQFLPGYARRALGNFIRNVYRHPDPKVALIGDQSGAQGLMVNLTAEQYNGDEGKLRAALRYLGWFLPRTYRVTAMPAGWSDSNFVPLG
jgi:hypothetical protein